MNTKQKLFSPEGASHYLGAEDKRPKVSTLSYWRSTGRGPKFVKIGRAVFYKAADLDEFIAAGLTDPKVHS